MLNILERDVKQQIINQLIDYLLFYSRSRIFHLYGDVTIIGEGLQNFRIIHTLEPGGIFIV
jgi:hypothetical protein